MVSQRRVRLAPTDGLNESPSQKEGKFHTAPTRAPPDTASMKVPPKRKGNSRQFFYLTPSNCLNESPSQKEGKWTYTRTTVTRNRASMKVPPKRKGNAAGAGMMFTACVSLNESPSQKEGKYNLPDKFLAGLTRLNESPSQKEGKYPDDIETL